MAIDEEAGEILEKFVDKTFDWRIGDINALLSRKDNETHYRSPDFEFSGFRWCLRLYPFGFNDSSEVIALLLVRRDDGLPTKVSYTLGIRTVFGINEKRIADATDIFDSNVICWWRRETFLPRNEFTSRMSELAPNNTLTVTCTLAAGYDLSTMRDLADLSKQMKELFLKGQNADVTFKVKDRSFPAHKNILGARSSVFATELEPGKVEDVNLSDCDPDVFKEFLIYLYSGSIEELSLSNVYSLYNLAAIYKVQALRERCVSFMAASLNTKNICDVFRTVTEEFEPELIERATSFFDSNVEEILETDDWRRFLREHPAEANELFAKSSRSALRGRKTEVLPICMQN